MTQKVGPGATPGFMIGSGDLPGASNAARGEFDQGSQCFGETRQAEAIGLDMFVMLDLSGSMLDPLPMPLAPATRTTKWDAVRQSLESFVLSPESAEIGIGLQYFPQSNPGVPFACSSNEACGVGGPCSNTLCVTNGTRDVPGDDAPPWAFYRAAGDAGTLCSTDADCNDVGGSCLTLPSACVFPPGTLAASPEGHFANVSDSPQTSFVTALCSSQADCAGVPQSSCEVVGLCSLAALQCSPSVACPPGSGECLGFPYTCSNYTSCDAARYAAPAVAISASEARSAEAIASLRAQVPVGATPTGPALRGALEHAQLWAEQHPDRQVVTVLATDGFPTVCAPLEIPDIAQLASAAASASRAVRTFVIGVFGDQDLDADGQQRLDEIARAGGSRQAVVVNTAGDVAADFLEALQVIRSTAVSCDFQLDPDARLSFDQVNLQLTDRAGSSTQLLNVGDGSACGADEGWYYVRDAAGVPLQLSVCPTTCNQLVSESARADLEIGCETRIR